MKCSTVAVKVDLVHAVLPRKLRPFLYLFDTRSEPPTIIAAMLPRLEDSEHPKVAGIPRYVNGRELIVIVIPNLKSRITREIKSQAQ